MQTQDKIAVDIGQISQETLKSYDRWRFFKYLFAGILATFIVFLVSLLEVDREHPYSPFAFGAMLFVSFLIILACLGALRRKRYSVFLFSDEGKAFTALSTEVIALFCLAASVIALYFQIKSGTGPNGMLMIFSIIITPVTIIAHNANDEFDADDTVYLPQRALRSKEKSEKAADEATGEQNLSQAGNETQAAQSEAAESERKFEGANREVEPSQSDEEAEALEYGKALAQIPENLKRRYQIHRLIRFAFVSFAVMAFLIISSNPDKELYGVFIVSAVCVLVFFFTNRRYSKLFIEDPEGSNAIFGLENFAIMTLVLYYPVGSLFFMDKAVHSSDAAATFVYLYLPLIPILSIITIVCLVRNLSVYEEIKE